MAKAVGSSELAGTIERTLLAAGAVAKGTASSSEVAPVGRSERYAVTGEIGRGGMGRVLEATDLQFSRKVAIKELLGDHNDAPQRHRFALEALVTGNLEHPSIAPVYERGEERGVPFYVMRRMRGRQLTEAIAEAATLTDRLKLLPSVIKTAQAIGFAHERGVIHRDIKPDNVMVDRHGETFVLDWGIAKVRGIATPSEALSAASDTNERRGGTTSETAHGSILGTPAYMAPEQAAGDQDAIDARTDVFALGALLYHVLAQRPPYSGKTVEMVVANAAAHRVERLVDVAPEVPAALRAICERAMAMRPEERYASATELAEALEGALTDALTGREWHVVNVFAALVSVGTLAGCLTMSTLVWRLLPSFAELGWGAYPVLFCGVVGTVFCVLEILTKGRYRLEGLVLAFTAMTFISGVLGTLAGIENTLRYTLKPEIMQNPQVWRETLTVGLYETLGCVIAGTAVGTLQVLLWGIARRRTSGAQASLSRRAPMSEPKRDDSREVAGEAPTTSRWSAPPPRFD